VSGVGEDAHTATCRLHCGIIGIVDECLSPAAEANCAETVNGAHQTLARSVALTEKSGSEGSGYPMTVLVLLLLYSSTPFSPRAADCTPAADQAPALAAPAVQLPGRLLPASDLRVAASSEDGDVADDHEVRADSLTPDLALRRPWECGTARTGMTTLPFALPLRSTVLRC
jgi:hypothetical protein